jgi:D-alanyl-D-alanine carboxypeptidase/D-alanyl-D-alanine-endopeptidase (penicillin-binding protein 4)
MNKKWLCFPAIFFFVSMQMYGQSVAEKLKKATNDLLNDEQLKHAIVSLYVTDTGGNRIFSLNEQYGLAPASTQKVFTSIAALSLLGEGFTYKTQIGYNGIIDDNSLKGDLIIKGYGDPTFGSGRYKQTKPDTVLNLIVHALHNAGIKKIKGNIFLDDAAFTYQPLPGGYIWEDIGNYYGAGTWGINWRENQYDLVLKPGFSEGDTSTLVKTDPELLVSEYNNFITTGPPGSGDNTILYLAPYSPSAFAEGTIPQGVNQFKVSGSFAYPADQLKAELSAVLRKNEIEFTGEIVAGASLTKQRIPIPIQKQTIATYDSPTLDSIVYWFLQKSINLYGEALLKTFAFNQDSVGSTIGGVSVLKAFWQQNGIDSSALNISDGSGLSPQNRVTTWALVRALLYARKQSWFERFYDALPVYNNMKLKSGTINCVRSFAGYYTAANGKQYVLAIIVNNYDDSMGSVTPKIFKLLDVLK